MRVSRLGFGGIPIQRVSEAEAARAVHAAIGAGVNFFDTAAGYSDSQAKIGKAVEGRREGLVIASKSGQGTKAGILADIEKALRELRTDYIDLYQLHGVSKPDKWAQCRGPGGALEGLIEARDKGRVRHIGFSSHSLGLTLELAGEPVFETVQFPFNLVTSEPARELIPKCRERNLGFIVMKPLCGGQYDNAGFAFKFLNEYPDLVPIPGVESAEQILEIAEIVRSGAVLEGSERAEAEAIAARLGKLFCRRCGYCEPCPNGVPIQFSMVFESFVRRFSREKLRSGPAKLLTEKAPACAECGECEAKCPYELPIMQTIRSSLAKARGIMAED